MLRVVSFISFCFSSISGDLDLNDLGAFPGAHLPTRLVLSLSLPHPRLCLFVIPEDQPAVTSIHGVQDGMEESASVPNTKSVSLGESGATALGFSEIALSLGCGTLMHNFKVQALLNITRHSIF